MDILFQSSFNAADRYATVSHGATSLDGVAKSFRCIHTDAAAIVKRPMALIDVASEDREWRGSGREVWG